MKVAFPDLFGKLYALQLNRSEISFSDAVTLV